MINEKKEEKQFSWALHKNWNQRKIRMFIQENCMYVWERVWERINTVAFPNRKEEVGSEAPGSGSSCFWTLVGTVGPGSLAAQGLPEIVGVGEVQTDICIYCDVLQFTVLCLRSECRLAALNLTPFMRNRAFKDNSSALDNYYVHCYSTFKNNS